MNDELVRRGGELLIKTIIEKIETEKKGINTEDIFLWPGDWIPDKKLKELIEAKQLDTEVHEYFQKKMPKERFTKVDYRRECGDGDVEYIVFIGLEGRDYKVEEQDGSPICYEYQK